MKKKIAVLGTLLMAVVITGYSVSGTYAKYVSEIDIEDEARVAKWKIGMNEESMETLDLFKKSYTYGTNGTVVSSLDDKKVVAPGTNGQYTFALTGDIETNYKIRVTATGTNTVTTTDETGTYDPIKFYVAKDGEGITTIEDIAESKFYNFDKLKEELNKLYSGTDNKVYAPGKVDSASYTIYWKWDFGTSEDKDDRSNLLDTKLGNEIVKDATSHKINLKINIRAEQTQDKATA